MLTGDNAATAKRIAMDLGIDSVYSDYPDRLADAVSGYRLSEAHVSEQPR